MIGTKWILGAVLVLVLGAAVAAPLVDAREREREREINLQPGPAGPGASGEIEFRLINGVLRGEIEAQDLPALGPHAFYVFWFVRTDTNDKVFLGPIVGDDSILFFRPGDGEMRFRAAAFTDGPAKDSPISFGEKGTNFFVLIAEKEINTFTPVPVSVPPSSFALTATF